MGKNRKQQAGKPPPPQQQQQPSKKERQRQQPAQDHVEVPRQDGSKSVHYTSFVQVLPTDIEHNSPSVLLFFDKERYLFNAGEGIQRLFREHRLKTKQVSQYFVTRITSETLGGLPGMTLSNIAFDTSGLMDGQAACVVSGPLGLADYVDSFRSYITRHDAVEVHEFDRSAATQVLKTDVVTITAVTVGASPTPAAAAAAEGAADGSPAAEVADASAAVAGTAEDGGGGDGAEDGPAAKRQRVEAPPAAAAASAGVSAPRSLARKGSRTGANEGGGVPARLHSVDTVVAYLAQLAGRPGKFQPLKAKELGIPPGPVYGLLQRGSAVVVPSLGRTVEPHEVCEAEVPGPVVALLDCPSLEHLARMRACGALRGALDAAAATEPGATPKTCVAIHTAPRGVVSHPDYLAWLAELAPAWRHVSAAAGPHQPSAIPRACTFQAQLHAIDAGVFPLLDAENAMRPPQLPQALRPAGGEAAAAAAAAAGGSAASALFPRAPLPEPGAGGAYEAVASLRLHLVPAAKEGLDASDVFQYDAPGVVAERLAAEMPELLRQAEAVQQAEDGGEEDKPHPGVLLGREVAELTFLGTASSQPSKYRNVSGCYVDLFARGGLLVDCGEDAMGQMMRRFGPEDGAARLRSLRCVWVSHMHADHHGGLYRLLEWRAHAGLPPLLVIGPMKLFNVLVKYSAVLPLRFTFLPNLHLSSPSGRPLPPFVMPAYEAAVRELGLQELRPFQVQHIHDAHGLLLRGRGAAPAGAAAGAGAEGGEWSIVFSADTRPCRQTIEAARGATLLVHEATFEESMGAEAKAKRHSTTAEAIQVGEEAGAYRTLLTHFSTRYPTLPAELDLSRHSRVAVAMDFMAVNLADLPRLPRVTGPMGTLFKALEDDGTEDDE